MHDPQSTRSPLLEMRGISKNFPGVRALNSVSFDLSSGEIHALVGENGAGKSTLMKILGGAYSEYEGEIRIRGQVQRFRNVHDATNAGVAVVFQELSLVRELSAAENILLGREPSRFGIVQWSELYAKAGALLDDLGFALDPRTPVSRLSTGQQQLVEIAKALSQKARILVLDEPTAALTDAEAANLFAILRKLRAGGMGIIYISHRLEEVFRLSDRITVLRDGSIVSTNDVGNLAQQQVITQMVGRELSQVFPGGGRSTGDTALEVRHLSAEDANGKAVVQDVSLSVRRGEILGIAGLMGAGRSELLTTIFGAWEGKVTGDLLIAGQPVAINRPADAIAHDIGLVTEDRKRSGLVLEQNIVRNATLAALREVAGRYVLDESREIAASEPLMVNLRLKAGSLFDPVGKLSGGNQQKVVVAKWLLTRPRILLLDEPTRGIDIGAKQEIYSLIDSLAKDGMAVIMVSSELPEVLGLADRILVLREGRITGEFTREQATPEAVMTCATGQMAHARVL
jgi:ABC-type sugar transport system ATPase subunit